MSVTKPQSLKFDFNEVSKNNIVGWLLKLIIPSLTKLVWALAPRIPKAVMEWIEEAQSVDGWTKKEKMQFALNELNELKAQQLGDPVMDRLIDYLIVIVEHQIVDILEDIEEKEHPIAATPRDPATIPLSDMPLNPAAVYFRILGFRPPADALEPGSVVYADASGQFYFVMRPGIGVPLPIGFTESFRIPFAPPTP